MNAVNEVFAQLDTTVPEKFPSPPLDWSDKPMPVRTYELSADLEELHGRAKAFWDPVLASDPSDQQRAWNGSVWLTEKD